MAFLESTEILKAVSKVEGSFGDAEFREGTNTTARLLFSNEATVFRNVKALKESVSQPTEAILQQRKVVATTTNKLSAHSGALGDSFVKAITYINVTRTFKVSYKLAENNQFGYQEQLNVGMLNAMMDARAVINAYGIAQLAALKTQVSAGSGLMAWDGVNFRYENAAAKLDKAASNIKAVARKNKYGIALDVVAGQQLASDLLHSAAQGVSNDENLQYQFNGLTMVEEETLDEATLGANGFGYIMPKGYVGMTSWNEAINRSGRGDVNANEGLFSTIADPIVPGLMYDIHIKRGLSDNAVTAKTYYQDPTDEYEISAYYAFNHALINVADASPIFAMKQI